MPVRQWRLARVPHLRQHHRQLLNKPLVIISQNIKQRKKKSNFQSRPPPQSFYNRDEQSQNNPVARQESPREERMPPGLFIKSYAPPSPPINQPGTVDQRV